MRSNKQKLTCMYHKWIALPLGLACTFSLVPSEVFGQLFMGLGAASSTHAIAISGDGSTVVGYRALGPVLKRFTGLGLPALLDWAIFQAEQRVRLLMFQPTAQWSWGRAVRHWL